MSLLSDVPKIPWKVLKRNQIPAVKAVTSLYPVKGCRTCRELCSLHIILSLTRHWETQFLFSSVEKERMSFSLQPRQVWDLILWGSEQRCAGFSRAWGNPRSQSCCRCFQKSQAAVPQAVLLLCCSKVPWVCSQNWQNCFSSIIRESKFCVFCWKAPVLKKRSIKMPMVQGLPVLSM